MMTNGIKQGSVIPYGGITPVISERAMIFEGVRVIGDAEIAEDCSIWHNCVLRGDESGIRIGKRTNVQDLTVIHVGHKNQKNDGRTIIGEDVTVGHNCIIHACVIERLCLIGMGSIVMDEALIGEMSILGAGSLVTKGKVFPPKSLIMGNPAKYVRELKEEEIEAIVLSASNYVELARSYFQ